MFRLKTLTILGSKAELALLPEGKLLINTVNAHSFNTVRKDALFAETLTKGGTVMFMGSSQKVLDLIVKCAVVDYSHLKESKRMWRRYIIGNALLYPNPYSRIPGDVDVWGNVSREEIRRLAYSLAKGAGSVGEESLNHIELTVKIWGKSLAVSGKCLIFAAKSSPGTMDS